MYLNFRLRLYDFAWFLGVGGVEGKDGGAREWAEGRGMEGRFVGGDFLWCTRHAY